MAKICLLCQKEKKENQFYISYSKMHTDKRVPYCKTCLKKTIVDNTGNINIEKVKEALRNIDKPYLSGIWESSVNENANDPFGMYIKNISMPQYRALTWKNSETEDIKNKILSSNSNEDINNLDELMEKWGYGYSEEEYRLFEKKWCKLIDNYGEKTSLHTEGLITYIRFRVKEEMSTARGDIKEAKDWGALASTAAKDAKLNVAQLSKSDISGGIELMPTLFEAVESQLGLISIMPHLKEQPYDDADLIIWCIVNYLRRLEDKPRVQYRDIWNFYDDMLEEHFKQKGYNAEQIKQEKDKRNNIFRDLGKVYKEPLYEEGDL